ncbi:MAG: hypothetical protein WCG34_07230 [Leptolinea sp.]
MSIHIAEIFLDGLQPQSALQFLPRSVNLIYGRNEFGKTRLVEFLLRSLFQSSGKMALRPVEATGRVRVSGLDGNVEVWFNPRSRDKLEDHLVKQEINLPPQLARLLVVKGAESELQAGYPGGLGRTALNEYISNQGLLDRIVDRVPKNTRVAQVQEGRIIGSIIGELKRRKEILDRLVVTDNLFTDIDLQVSGGPLAEMAAHLADLQASAVTQRNARQGFVNQMAMELDHLQQQSYALPTREILDLEADIREEIRVSVEISRFESSHKEKEPLLEAYQWLAAALQTYQITPILGDSESQWLLPLLAGAGVIGTVVFAFLNIPWITAVFAGIALFIGFLAFRQFRFAARAAVVAPENQRIAAEFERRFGAHCSGLADLQARKTALERDINLIQNLAEQIQTAKRRMYDLSTQIESRLSKWLPGIPSSPAERQLALQEIQSKRAELDDALRKVEIGLKTAPVQPIAGGTVGEAGLYDPQNLAESETEIALVQNKILQIQQQKIILKQRICDLTSDPISNDLMSLILSLQDYRADLEKSGRTLTAEILAGIAVTQAMQELRTGEDTALQSALQSSIIRNSLKSVTSRYNRIDLNGDGLEVSDDYQTFRLAELSTGAQEQVLLGLRIGLASRLFAGQPLFLILDDAFQHSDWQRRPAMVDEVLRLAKTGWQIFYLTMDDHLRDLFLEKSLKELGDDFFSITLKGE